MFQSIGSVFKWPARNNGCSSPSSLSFQSARCSSTPNRLAPISNSLNNMSSSPSSSPGRSSWPNISFTVILILLAFSLQTAGNSSFVSIIRPSIFNYSSIQWHVAHRHWQRLCATRRRFSCSIDCLFLNTILLFIFSVSTQWLPVARALGYYCNKIRKILCRYLIFHFGKYSLFNMYSSEIHLGKEYCRQR